MRTAKSAPNEHAASSLYQLCRSFFSAKLPSRTAVTRNFAEGLAFGRYTESTVIWLRASNKTGGGALRGDGETAPS